MRHALPSLFFVTSCAGTPPKLWPRRRGSFSSRTTRACSLRLLRACLSPFLSHLRPSATCPPPQNHCRLQLNTRATRIMAASMTRRSRTYLLWGWTGSRLFKRKTKILTVIWGWGGLAATTRKKIAKTVAAARWAAALARRLAWQHPWISTVWAASWARSGTRRSPARRTCRFPTAATSLQSRAAGRLSSETRDTHPASIPRA